MREDRRGGNGRRGRRARGKREGTRRRGARDTYFLHAQEPSVSYLVRFDRTQRKEVVCWGYQQKLAKGKTEEKGKGEQREIWDKEQRTQCERENERMKGMKKHKRKCLLSAFQMFKWLAPDCSALRLTCRVTSQCFLIGGATLMCL